jgi:hypothetical protein
VTDLRFLKCSWSGAAFVCLTLFLCSTLAIADHGATVIKGKPEQVIADLNVGRTTIAQAIRILGKPNKVDEISLDSTTVRDRKYQWTRGVVVITAFAYFYGEAKSIVRAIEIEYSDQANLKTTPVGTGHGLRLGDPYERLNSLYGLRLTSPPRSRLVLEWQNRNQLEVDVNKRGIIVRLLLRIGEE